MLCTPCSSRASERKWCFLVKLYMNPCSAALLLTKHYFLSQNLHLLVNRTASALTTVRPMPRMAAKNLTQQGRNGHSLYTTSFMVIPRSFKHLYVDTDPRQAVSEYSTL